MLEIELVFLSEIKRTGKLPNGILMSKSDQTIEFGCHFDVLLIS